MPKKQAAHLKIAFPETLKAMPPEGPVPPFLTLKKMIIAEFEFQYLTEILRRCNYNYSHASQMSGINRTYLCKILRKNKVTLPEGVTALTGRPRKDAA